MLPLAVVLGAYVAAWFWRHWNVNHGDGEPKDMCSEPKGTRASAASGAADADPHRPLAAHPYAEAIKRLSRQAPPLQLPPRRIPIPAPPLGSSKEDYVFIHSVPNLAAAAMEL